MGIEEYIKDGRLSVIVKPCSPKNEVLGWDTERKALRVAISEPADKDKANKEVIKFFTKLLKKKVRIKVGLRSKEKVLEIIG